MLKLIALGVCLLSILPCLNAAKAIKGKTIAVNCIISLIVNITLGKKRMPDYVKTVEYYYYNKSI